MRRAGSWSILRGTRSTTSTCPGHRCTICGTIPCAGGHTAEITDEIIGRVEQKCPEKFSLAQVTLDGMSREHGKGIDMRALAPVRELLLDLKIRVIAAGEESAVPLQQDVRAIDYLAEFSSVP